MAKSDRHKIRVILRREMKKLPTQEQINSLPKKSQQFGFCFAQAKFDLLMDLDRELQLGAFYNKKR